MSSQMVRGCKKVSEETWEEIGKSGRLHKVLEYRTLERVLTKKIEVKGRANKKKILAIL